MSTSLTSLPPATETAKDTVTCRVFINDNVLTEVSLLQLTVNKSFNKISVAKMVFQDGSAADRNFPLSNDAKFKPGNKISIQLGYHGETTLVFKGMIIKHAIKAGRAGGSFLIIEAKDEAIKLTMVRKTVNFPDKKDCDVIKQLSGSMATDFTTTVTHSQLVQFDCTDWDFILTRAEANGLLVFTDDGKIKPLKPDVSGTPVLTAKFGENILEFEADMDARRQLKKITGHSWDYKKQTIESQDLTANFTESGDIPSDELGKVLDAEAVLSHTGYLTKDQTKSWAAACSLRNKLSKAIGRVRVEGNASVKPGSVIKLDGVGNHFNGNVYVSGVLHQYDGTWYTDIQFGWKEEWFYNKEKVMEKAAAGLLPGVNGLQIGKVQETNDSDGEFRVKVYFSTTKSDTEGIWARLAMPDAGKEHGFVFRPQVGDEVVLGFLNDDPRDAIILGCLHSKDKNASPLSAEKTNLEYGVITKQKQKLVINESKKMITIVASPESGEKTIILNDSDAIVMKDNYGNLIKMEKTGITIESNGEIIINGKKMVKINS